MTERSAQQREPLDLDGLVASLREWATVFAVMLSVILVFSYFCGADQPAR